MNVLKDSKNFIDISNFKKIYNNGVFDINLHSGITDEISLIRRIINFNKISELFILLEDEINKVFKLKIGDIKSDDDIIALIETFLNGIEKTELEKSETKEKIRLFIEQMPLFYLMRNIDVIKKSKFQKPKPKSGREGAIVVEYMNDLLQDVLYSKLMNYCKKYNVGKICNEYISLNQLSGKVSEDKFNDYELQENIIENENIIEKPAKTPSKRSRSRSKSMSKSFSTNDSTKNITRKRSRSKSLSETMKISLSKNKTRKRKKSTEKLSNTKRIKISIGGNRELK